MSKVKMKSICIFDVRSRGVYLGRCEMKFKDTRWGRFLHRFVTGHRAVR